MSSPLQKKTIPVEKCIKIIVPWEYQMISEESMKTGP